MKTQSRINRDQLFLDIAALFGLRSTCPRAQVGAVAVQDGRIVATGYNGAPAGMPHCTEVGCDIRIDYKGEETPDAWALQDGRVEIAIESKDKEEHCIRTVHAESNVIAWSARKGVSLEKAELYSTHTTCQACAKLIINAGIQAVHFSNNYGHDGGLKLLYAAGVLVHLPK